MTTEDEARKELSIDSQESLAATFDEYCPDTPIPTDREKIIAQIISAMIAEGHVTTNTTQTFKLSDLARQHNINPKVARDKLRRAAAKQTLPQSIKSAGWVFSTKDTDTILQIIKKKQNEQL